MAIVNKPNTFSGNTTISSSEVNSNFDTIYNEFNGSISAANLADDAVTAAKLADNAVVTANITDAAVTPAKLLAGTGSTWVWQSWTPTWTNLTVSSSTVVAKYVQIGKTVHLRMNVILGGGNAPSGVVKFTLPVTAIAYGNAANGSLPLIGRSRFENVGVDAFVGVVDMDSTTTARPLIQTASSSYVTLAGLATTVPFTWGNGDEMTITATYEAA